MVEKGRKRKARLRVSRAFSVKLFYYQFSDKGFGMIKKDWLGFVCDLRFFVVMLELFVFFALSPACMSIQAHNRCAHSKIFESMEL